MTQATARDAAAYIRARMSDVGRTQLLKLLYYGQVWSIVWDGAPLFDDKIEAWNAGPVVRCVWEDDRYGLLGQRGTSHVLTAAQRETLDAVIEFYGGLPGGQLSELTHRELPWMQARASGQNTSIDPSTLAYFYGTLPELRDCRKRLPESYRKGLEMLLAMSPEEVDELYRDMGLGEAAQNDPGPEWLNGC